MHTKKNLIFYYKLKANNDINAIEWLLTCNLKQIQHYKSMYEIDAEDQFIFLIIFWSK